MLEQLEYYREEKVRQEMFLLEQQRLQERKEVEKMIQADRKKQAYLEKQKQKVAEYNQQKLQEAEKQRKEEAKAREKEKRDKIRFEKE